jgi:hypothetical protein
MLNPVSGDAAPQYPFTDIRQPPEGVAWSDISYVVGGYNWKALFLDSEGYLLTGDTQFNFFNPVLDLGGNYVPYHVGEQVSYDCGSCHTTGYSPRGHQDDLPGIVGTWALPGVQCEACHGPGSLHANAPLSFEMKVERDSAACGECHATRSFEQVTASDGFIQHHEEYQELYQSKHLVLDCVDCHDPHAGVIRYRQEGGDPTRTDCANCHFKNAQYQNNPIHEQINIQCIDCHMPRMTVVAEGNPETFTGDLRSHVMAIDPFQVDQFVTLEDGTTVSRSQISLNFACRHCHNPDGLGQPKTDEELLETAINYHVMPEQPVQVDETAEETPEATSP